MRFAVKTIYGKNIRRVGAHHLKASVDLLCAFIRRAYADFIPKDVKFMMFYKGVCVCVCVCVCVVCGVCYV